MKKTTDERIQELLEKGALPDAGLPAADAQDLQAYRRLFDALGQQPDITLPANFHSTVTARLLAGKAKAADRRLYTVVILALLLTMAGAFAMLPDMQGLTISLSPALLKYKWAFLFGLGSLLLIQYLDQQLVKRRRLPH